MPITSLPFGFWLDPTEPLHDSGAPTFGAPEVWHDSVEIVSMLDMGREELEAATGDFLVKKMIGGAWAFPITVNFRPSSEAKILVWNTAVAANAAISYKFLPDRNTAAGAANPQVIGAVIPTGLIMGGVEAHGGFVARNMTLQPGGAEPYIAITGAAEVFYGKLN